MVDVETLIEVLYQTEFPMDFASILASPVEYHPLATGATGESTDLRPLITDEAELRLALRASASLPFLACRDRAARPPFLRRRSGRVDPVPHSARPGRDPHPGAPLPPPARPDGQRGNRGRRGRGR